jgi:hypothetical protein
MCLIYFFALSFILLSSAFLTLTFLLFVCFSFFAVPRNACRESREVSSVFIAVLFIEAFFLKKHVSSLQKFLALLRDVVSLDEVQQEVSSSNEVATRLKTH